MTTTAPGTARAPALARSSSSRVVFAKGGQALLDGVEVPMTLEGLVVDAEQRLTLALLPTWPVLPPRPAPPASRPCALAVWRGRAYFLSDDGSAVRVRDCAGDVAWFAPVGGSRSPGSVASEVAALAVTPRDTLLVADRARGSVRELDLTTSQTVWTWDVPGVDDVTVAPDGEIYVSCSWGIVRLDPDRRFVLTRRTGPTSRRSSLAWARVDGTPVLFVALGANVVMLDLATGTIRRGQLPRLVPPDLRPPVAIRWSEDRLYVGSPTSLSIRVVDTTSWSRLGELPGTPCAHGAFGVEGDSVWVADGVSAEKSIGSVTVPIGTAAVGPIPLKLDRATAHTIRVRLVGLPAGADAGVATGFDGAALDPVPSGPDVVVSVPPEASAMRAGVTLRGAAPLDRSPRPGIAALELRVDEPGWIEQLPVIYRNERARPEQFLDPFLQLARSALDDVVDGLRALPDQIDPATSYDDLAGERWLDWLSGWVDVRLDETMSRRVRRALVSGAFERHGTRGTAGQLRETLSLEAGLDDVVIAQPGDTTSVWVLGADTAELGQRTMTAAAPPDGSILDTTAVADRSHLIGPADYGAPLFGDIAHRFDVLVHAAHLRCPEDRDRVVALIERERPAHATAHLCVIEPGISVGIQARVGIDSVIGEVRQHAVGGLDGFASPTDRDRVVLGGDGGLGLTLT
jgi:phage tail-like protein